MKSTISCCRLVRSMRELLDRNGRRGLDRTCVRESSAAHGRTQGTRPVGRGYTGRPRACGGIGRRARLRALWTEWSVEVRVLSGALEKPRIAGLFSCLTPARRRRLAVWVLLPRGNNPHFYPHLGNEMWVPGNALWVRSVSVRYHRGGWETRWRDASGQSRSKRFKSEDAARAYDEAVREVSPAARRADTCARRVGRLLLLHARGGPLAVRRAPQRRQPDLQAWVHEPAGGGRSQAPPRRAGRTSARSSTPPRRSAATGSDGWPAAAPTSRRALGAATRSAAASGCCPLSPTSALGHSRSMTSARSSPSRPRPWRPANSQPRRSTTRWSRSSSASTTPSRTVSSWPTPR